MGVFIGFLLGAVMTFGLGINAIEDDLNKGTKANKLVEDCQKTLPRNVECVIVAIPEYDLDNSEVTYHKD